MFEKFEKEIRLHGDGKYHCHSPVKGIEEVEVQLNNLGIYPCFEYIDFLKKFGPGSYYGGLLKIYPIEGPGRSLKSELKWLNNHELFPIGDGGSSEFMFCLSRSKIDNYMYVYSVFDNVVEKKIKFPNWVNGSQKEFFSKEIFKACSTIFQELLALTIEYRKMFEVDLISASIEKVKKTESDFIPCYNKVTVKVKKYSDNPLKWLTFKVIKNGSSIGTLNVVYHSIDVSKMHEGETLEFDELVFDQFAISFTGISMIFEPKIDMERTSQYKELVENIT